MSRCGVCFLSDARLLSYQLHHIYSLFGRAGGPRWVLLQVLASETQQLLEAATRLLLVTPHASEGAAAGLKLRIAAAAQIGMALRSSQEALQKALKTPTLTSGKREVG